MNFISDHLNWFKDTGEEIKTEEGKTIRIFIFDYVYDEKILNSWACHFRNHYCLDNEIDILRDGTNLTRKEYLEKIKFPDKSSYPGPLTRAGDFSEILISDYLEYILGYWVPRTRYRDKVRRNESTKGVDIIGFKFFHSHKFSAKDELITWEVKSKYTGKLNESILQKAIKDSGKDFNIRLAESLNSIKQRLEKNKEKISRFQNFDDNPYKLRNGAAAFIVSTLLKREINTGKTTSNHPNQENLSLIIVHGKNMMDLIHELYKRAANEA